MKRLIFFLVLFLLAFVTFVSAQEKPAQKLKVAIFDPAISGKDFDEGTGVMVREMVSTAIMSTGKYTIIERSLINKILQEQKFSNSGAVDETQISQLGKLAGANKIILSVLSSAGNKGLLSLKMIDVESASIENQKTQLVNRTQILDIVTPLALEVIGEQVPDQDTESTASSGKSDKGIKGLFGKVKDNATPDQTPKSNKEKFIERTNNEELTLNPSNQAGNEGNILLTFPGFKSKSNSTASIYVDDVKIGTGTLNEGFQLYFRDDNPGARKVKIEWDNNIGAKTFTINTSKKKQFIFEYAKTGFGYDFQLKK